MPDPRSVTFSSEQFVGYKNGRSDAFDEYGRKPWHKDYNDKTQRDYEWKTFQAFQGEYSAPKEEALRLNLAKKIKLKIVQTTMRIILD